MTAWRTFLARSLLLAYKMTLSPVLALFGARCRYAPTCSEYAAGCVARHGIWPGVWMTLARLSRCRPGGSAGHDPVPMQKRDIPFWTPWRYGDWSLTDRPFPDQGPAAD